MQDSHQAWSSEQVGAHRAMINGGGPVCRRTHRVLVVVTAHAEPSVRARLPAEGGRPAGARGRGDAGGAEPGGPASAAGRAGARAGPGEAGGAGRRPPPPRAHGSSARGGELARSLARSAMTSSRGSAPPPAGQIACQLSVCLKPWLSKSCGMPRGCCLDSMHAVVWGDRPRISCRPSNAWLRCRRR
jgi:hypothetical protein